MQMRRISIVISVVSIILIAGTLSSAETINYTHDTMGRLIKAQYGDGTVVDYVYDNMGNGVQKATTLSGSPANTPPNAATNPGLSDGSTDVSTTPSLTWTGGGDPDTGDQMVYYVYLGTSQDPPLVSSGRQSSYVPGNLRSKTTYYWKVVSRDSHNTETSSPLWSFTTEHRISTISFIAAPPYGTAPLKVHFIDKSGDFDQQMVSWAWDFDSNGTIDSTVRNPVYTYQSPGKYSVTLTVIDSQGGSGTLKKDVTVYEHQGDIAGNVTWTRENSPYYISNTIRSTGTLTIEPGVVVKFEQGAGLEVLGTLNAVGTPEDPIYFTDIRDDAAGGDTFGDGSTTVPTPGWWGGIRIEGGTAILDHTVIRYAGSLRGDPNIYVGSSGGSSCGSLSLTNSAISYSASYGIHTECASAPQIISANIIERNEGPGIYLNDTIGGATISGNTIRFNKGYGIYKGASNESGDGVEISGNTIMSNEGYGIYIDASTEPPVLSGNTISGNTLGRVATGGTVARNVTWSKAGSPYVIRESIWVNSGKTLTIESGAVLKFYKDTFMAVTGGLIAGGTSAEPIYFTDLRDDSVGGDTNGDGSATSPAPGWWYGIRILEGGTATLDHVVVRYGGPRIPDSNHPGYFDLYGNIYKIGAGSVSITNSTISDSAAYGIHIENTSEAQTISGNIMERNADSGIYLRDAGSKVMIGGNTIRDNESYGIDIDDGTMPILSNNTIDGNTLGSTVREGTISRDMTWTKAGNPYVVGSIDIDTNATLTVEPGVVIKFVKDGAFYVDGGLHAVGTSTEPIYFTDLRDDAIGGDTNGDGTATTPASGWWSTIYIGYTGTALLDHTVVRYGGGGNYYGASIYNDGSMNITNSLISHSSTDGIYINGTAGQTISGNTIARNLGCGISFWNVGRTVLTNNIIFGNNNGGVSYNSPGNYFYGSDTIDIINNTIAGNGNSSTNDTGIALWTFTGPTINFYNNIVWGNIAKNGIQLRVIPQGTINGFNNDIPDTNVAFDTSGANISADPIFVDAANGNYHLSSSSPCIDKGSNSAPSLPTSDFEGDIRIIGLAVDIGADEYTIFPNTSITSMPPNPSKTNSAAFTFASTMQNSTFTCSLDSPESTAFAPCTSPWEYASLLDGNHIFYVKATVPAGYSEPTPATYTWTIDTIGSNPSVVNGTSQTNNTRPTWTWTSGGGGGNGRYRYKLDNIDLTTGATETMATSYTPALALTEGAHTLYVQEMDDAGNWSASGSKTISVNRRTGDVDGNGEVNLADAILALQALVRMPVGGVHVGVDVNNDGKIGLPEAIYILQKVAGMR